MKNEMPVFEHYFLIQSIDFESACDHITRFLESYALLSYDHLKFDREGSRRASDPGFTALLEILQQRNKEIIKQFLNELFQEGYAEIFDLAEIPQGYLSKIFHTLAHLLDGFLGIDSYFYNLEEDSHGISPQLKRKLLEIPDRFWLIKVYGFTEIEEPRFEVLKPRRQR